MKKKVSSLIGIIAVLGLSVNVYASSSPSFKLDTIEDTDIQTINEVYEKLVNEEEVDVDTEDTVKDANGVLHDIDEDGAIRYEVTVTLEEGYSGMLFDFLQKVLNTCGLNQYYTDDFEIGVSYNPYIKVSTDMDSIKAVTSGTGNISLFNADVEIDVTVNVVSNGSSTTTASSSDTSVNNSNNSTSSSLYGEDDTEDSEDGVVGVDETVDTSTDTDETDDTTETEQVENQNVETPTITNYFSDISHRAWAVDAINNMASLGYLKGVGNGLFRPDDNCKRCDFIIADVKMAKLRAQELETLNFVDIDNNAYYSIYLQIAVDNGVVSNSTSFRPNDYITREEAAMVIYNTLLSKELITPVENATEYINTKYSDASSVDSTYASAIASLTEKGLMAGTATTEKPTFEPKAKITRAQMAVLLNNVYNSLLANE
jgi:hypothetical protein